MTPVSNAVHNDILKRELDGLCRYFTRLRQEVAAIQRPAEAEHGFSSMGQQLDAVVQATAEASNTIMNAMEMNGTAVQALKKEIKDPKLVALLDQIEANGNAVFEACSFQDITGQRVTKVVKSIAYIEERVGTLIRLIGKTEIEKTEVVVTKEKNADEKLLQGPQLQGQGLSQADIDALFS
jgi:chemotaxis protein CheZ